MKLYGLKINFLNDENIFCEKLLMMPESRRHRIINCKSVEERKRLLAAGILLEETLQKQGLSSFDICMEEGGKPYLPGQDKFYFNISHSGEYVFCVTAFGPVGIDIQIRRKTSINLAKRFFQKEEWQYIDNAVKEKQEELFFRYWSVKEGYLKLTGEGIRGGLDGFFVDLETGIISDYAADRKAYFKEYRKLAGYSIAVVSYENFFPDDYTLYTQL